MLNALPEDQIDLQFVELLIYTFKNSNDQLPIHRMLDFVKYDKPFNDYKAAHVKENLDQYNIISFLTATLLSQTDKHEINLGFHFCQECAQCFLHHPNFLKEAFFYLKQNDSQFYDDGTEFDAVLKLDNNFFIDFLKQKCVDDNYLSFKLEHLKVESIWSLPNSFDVVDGALEIILQKSPAFSNWEHPAAFLFIIQNADRDLNNQVHNYLKRFIDKHCLEQQPIIMIMNIILHRFHDRFIGYLKQFLILNKDVELFKGIWLSTGGVSSGSRVPRIQKEIDFIRNITSMIKTLPDILDYNNHLADLEQRIVWLKKEIDNEQRRDFEDFYN